jgi:hypothetical protein
MYCSGYKLLMHYARMSSVRKRRLAPVRRARNAAPALFCSGGRYASSIQKTVRVAEVPVILCDEWSEAQVKAFRLIVNRYGERMPRTYIFGKNRASWR